MKHARLARIAVWSLAGLLVLLSAASSYVAFRMVVGLHERHVAAVGARAEWKTMQTLLLNSMITGIDSGGNTLAETLSRWQDAEHAVSLNLERLTSVPTITNRIGPDTTHAVQTAVRLWNEAAETRRKVEAQIRFMSSAGLELRIAPFSLTRVYNTPALHGRLSAREIVLVGTYINAATVFDADSAVFDQQFADAVAAIAATTQGALRAAMATLILLYVMVTIAGLLGIAGARKIKRADRALTQRAFQERSRNITASLNDPAEANRRRVLAMVQSDPEWPAASEQNTDDWIERARELDRTLSQRFPISVPTLILGAGHSFLLVFSYREERETQQIELIAASLQDQQPEFSRVLDRSVSIALCTDPVLLSSLDRARRTLTVSLERTFVDGRSAFYRTGLDQSETRTTAYPEASEREYLGRLRMHQVEPAMEVLKEVVRSTAQESVISARSAIYKLLSETARFIEMLGAQYRRVETNQYVHRVLGLLQAPNERIIQTELERCLRELFQEIDDASDSAIEETIDRVRTMIANEFTDANLSVATIASRVGYSSDYLGRMFRVATGTSVSQAINEARVEQLRVSLIERPEKTVQELAHEAGMTNAKYTYTLFKRAHGVTPAEYRRRVRVAPGQE